MKIGEIISTHDQIRLNENRKTSMLNVRNTGDRPIQVGSHFHFFEVNKLLRFDRTLAFGMRLDIPSGTSVRFEPGEEKNVGLVEFGGKKIIHGLNNLTCGHIDSETFEKAMQNARSKGFSE